MVLKTAVTDAIPRDKIMRSCGLQVPGTAPCILTNLPETSQGEYPFQLFRGKVELIHKLLEVGFLIPDNLGDRFGASLPGTEKGKEIVLGFPAVQKDLDLFGEPCDGKQPLNDLGIQLDNELPEPFAKLVA